MRARALSRSTRQSLHTSALKFRFRTISHLQSAHARTVPLTFATPRRRRCLSIDLRALANLRFDRHCLQQTLGFVRYVTAAPQPAMQDVILMGA